MSLSTSASRAFRRIESFALRRPTAAEVFPASVGDPLALDTEWVSLHPFGNTWKSESTDRSDEGVCGLLVCPDMIAKTGEGDSACSNLQLVSYLSFMQQVDRMQKHRNLEHETSRLKSQYFEGESPKPLKGAYQYGIGHTSKNALKGRGKRL